MTEGSIEILLFVEFFVSGLVLYLVYGVGARDLSERLEAKKKRKAFFAKIFRKKAAA